MGGNALCWGKVDYCNPFFEGDDLNDGMLDCYCPNNRKGFYTKKVKRIENNTHFCYDDPTVDERIRQSQANRMFHLCENWCLFDTFYPARESWYWDPWKVCWRETWAAVDVHRGYCDRVIRNPDTIELRYLNHRSEHFCGASKPPTAPPVDYINTTWFLGEAGETCDEACASNGLQCASEQTATRFNTESQLISAFAEGGYDCDPNRIAMNITRMIGWALPGLRGTMCFNRQPTPSHLEDLTSDCHREIGSFWKRLCACF